MSGLFQVVGMLADSVGNGRRPQPIRPCNLLNLQVRLPICGGHRQGQLLDS
jgi:hypothetical protein